MNSGKIDERTLILNVEWTSPEDSEPSGDEDDEEMLDFYGNDGDDEDEDEEDEDDDEDEEGSEDEDDDEEQEVEDESEIELPPPPSKRKRTAEPLKVSAVPPKKRVAFNLQKPAKDVDLPSKSALPGSGLRKPALASKKRR